MRRDQLTGRDFGRRLQAWRYTRRLTQQQLADALGYDVSYIVKIEGGRRPPTAAFLARLAPLVEDAADLISEPCVGETCPPPLPQPPAALVGRGDAVVALERLLTGTARCVTLVGPPGIGKTRLAMEAALRLEKALDGGVWWVPLLGVSCPENVEDALCRALGIPERSSSTPLAAVLDRLRDQEALVVFDNFEHVIEARTVASGIVAGARGVTVLVTSREPLGILSEHVFAVPALSFPDPLADPSFEAVRASTAVELFVARASMTRPQFMLTEENFRDVLTACARLDGLPLAIVLAAGAMRTVDPAGLVQRLGGRLDVHDSPPGDLPPHHRTLEAAITWSWDRLGLDERDLFASVAVFSGGFTSDAAAAVDGRDPDEVGRLLADLSRKSLVEARPEAASGPRFELLETTRSYARSHLARSGRLDELRRRHATHFVLFAEDLGRRLVGQEQVACARALNDDLENLQAAFDWALGHDSDAALRLAASCWRFFLMGDIPTGRRWLDAALQISPDATPARANALAAAGALAWITGDAAGAASRLAEAAALARQLDLPDVGALALVNEGALAEQQDRLDDAEEGFAAALCTYERIGDRRGRGVALNGLGMVRRRRGDLRGAWPLWTEAAALFRAVGDGTNEAIALGNKAWAAEAEGRLDEAHAISLECRRIQLARGDARGLAATDVALGRIAFLRGRLEEAKALQLSALRRFQRLGDLPWAASTLLVLAAIEERMTARERAATLLGAAEALWDQIGGSPREEEQALLDRVVAGCTDGLDCEQYERAVTSGRSLTVREAVSLASAPPAAMA